MTGQHTGHCTVRKNSQVWPMRAEDVTVAEVLKQADYATGGFGKWGCGDRGTTGVPEKHGFDIFFGYYNQTHAHSFFPNYLVRNGEKVPLAGNTGDYYKGKQFSHHLIFDESIKFIRNNKDRPFFCYCAWTPPHGQWGIPDDEPAWLEFKDKPWPDVPKAAKVYAAMVKMVDRQIGQIFALLKELNIDDNTIVFVCGDNGGRGGFDNFFDPPASNRRIILMEYPSSQHCWASAPQAAGRKCTNSSTGNTSSRWPCGWAIIRPSSRLRTNHSNCMTSARTSASRTT